MLYFFFFQAEDGIRDYKVTGVQTCALPILWLYFAGNCRYEPQGMTPAYRPDLADGWLDIRVVEAAVLARSRMVAAMVTGTLGRSRVYCSWRGRTGGIQAADGPRIWVGTHG